MRSGLLDSGNTLLQIPTVQQMCAFGDSHCHAQGKDIALRRVDAAHADLEDRMATNFWLQNEQGREKSWGGPED